MLPPLDALLWRYPRADDLNKQLDDVFKRETEKPGVIHVPCTKTAYAILQEIHAVTTT